MWSDNAEEFIKQALSPAKVASVELNEQTKEAAVAVGEDQFSLAIGRGGQNVRLAAELTGWRITVVEDGNEKPVAVSSEDDEDAIKEKLELDKKEAEEKKADEVADVVSDEVAGVATEEVKEETVENTTDVSEEEAIDADKK